MSYIIDGHNLIGALPDIHLNQPDDELRLLDRLRSFQARAGGRSMIVFFDSGPYAGQPRSSAVTAPRPGLASTPGIEVRFARAGQSADDAIADFLHASKQPGQCAVVTNDRALAARARGAGASVLSASEFAAQVMRRVSRPRKAPSPDTSLTPNPHDPAFADLAASFLAAEKASSRFPAKKPADVDAWIERLYEGDPQLAERAAQWLGEFGGHRAVEPLADALTHQSANVRAAALLGLGRVGNKTVHEAICDRLLHDGNSMVREAAAQCLGLIGNRSAEGALETALRDDPKGKVRKASQAALDAIRARAKPPSPH
jgi:uncharacterized protein